jgi:glyoxylase-like metal-dependent hydrolase (beta-lactamase superfamily II)
MAHDNSSSASPHDDFRSVHNPFEKQLVRRHLKIGPYQIRPVPTTIFGLDGGAMFGTVPKVLWEKSNPADSKNRIPMEARALLLDGGPGQRILIDCGIGGDFIAKYGEKLGAKFAEMYAIQNSEGASVIESRLHEMGLTADDISHVIFTHLHFDHCGGAVKYQDGRLAPMFANARYYVQKANYETAIKPNLREKASYFANNFEPLMAAGRLTLIDGPTDALLPCISVSVSDGHTEGHQSVKVSDGTTTLLYCGDLIPTSSHIRLPWLMGYDLNPLRLMEEKRMLLEPAAREGWYLFFEHDPYMDAATVAETKGDFAALERLVLA